jgi:hypothetical protein
MINPFRRLMYETFVLPFVTLAQHIIDLTKDTFHRLPLQRNRQRKPYLWRWENDTRQERRSM